MPQDFGTAHTCDVVVIGGGIIGCSIAFRLAQAKLKVNVLDRGEPGAEASSAAAGMLAPQGEMAASHNFFELCSASRDLYPHFVAEVEELAGHTVGYRRDGTLLVAIEDKEAHELDQIYERQTRCGLTLEKLSAEAVRSRVPGLSPEILSGLFIPGDHWVENERLTQALIEACRRVGVKVFNNCGVTKIHHRDMRVESVEAGAMPAEPGGTFSADRFVLAAGCWSSELVAPLGITIPVNPCRGQMIEFESPTELPLAVRAGHHYLVPRSPHRILAGTTSEYAGFEKEVTGEGLRSILDGVTRIAPLVKNLRFRRAWAGLRPDTPDHLPILGLGEFENLVLATGHFRNGILLAPVTAQLISELIIEGSTSMPIDAYRPTRFASSPVNASPPTAANRK